MLHLVVLSAAQTYLLYKLFFISLCRMQSLQLACELTVQIEEEGYAYTTRFLDCNQCRTAEQDYDDILTCCWGGSAKLSARSAGKLIHVASLQLCVWASRFSERIGNHIPEASQHDPQTEAAVDCWLQQQPSSCGSSWPASRHVAFPLTRTWQPTRCNRPGSQFVADSRCVRHGFQSAVCHVGLRMRDVQQCCHPRTMRTVMWNRVPCSLHSKDWHPE